MAALEGELGARRESQGAEALAGKEILKQSLQTITNTQPSQATSTTPRASSDEDSLLPDYVKSAPPEAKLQVEKLLGIALQKGIVEAAEEAKKGDPYVLDAFHDALVEKLYPELRRRGLVP